MVELRYLPIAVDILIADTAHMSAEQFGAYVRLLLTAWLHGAKLRNDPDELARIVGVTRSRWKRLAPVVLKPMTVTPEVITQQRLTKTWFQVRENRNKRAAAGRLGARKRWKNND